jgi:hypothetical protein
MSISSGSNCKEFLTLDSLESGKQSLHRSTGQLVTDRNAPSLVKNKSTSNLKKSFDRQSRQSFGSIWSFASSISSTERLPFEKKDPKEFSEWYTSFVDQSLVLFKGEKTIDPSFTHFSIFDICGKEHIAPQLLSLWSFFNQEKEKPTIEIKKTVYTQEKIKQKEHDVTDVSDVSLIPLDSLLNDLLLPSSLLFQGTF